MILQQKLKQINYLISTKMKARHEYFWEFQGFIDLVIIKFQNFKSQFFGLRFH